MRYHEPEIDNLFEENEIISELFATPWFLTMFSSKLDLEITYAFWEIYIIENDPLFVFYFSLAFISNS